MAMSEPVTDMVSFAKRWRGTSSAAFLHCGKKKKKKKRKQLALSGVRKMNRGGVYPQSAPSICGICATSKHQGAPKARSAHGATCRIGSAAHTGSGKMQDLP